MNRLLLVDEDNEFLAAIQGSSFRSPPSSTLSIANSFTEALDLIKSQFYDAVFVNARVPCKNCSQLLETVKQLYPDSTRVVLSNQSSSEMVRSSNVIAHHYIQKPCDIEQFANIVTRVSATRDALSSPGLRSFISRLASIPAMSEHVVMLVKELDSSDPSIRKICEQLQGEAKMASKVLQLVNSNLFGCPRKFKSILDATLYLGIDMLKPLLIVEHMFNGLSTTVSARQLRSIHAHRMLTGYLAKIIATHEGLTPTEIGNAYMGGMLHDVGTVVMMSLSPSVCDHIKEYCEFTGCSQVEAELHLFGTTHPQVGGYILNSWDLPFTVIESVVESHDASSRLLTGNTIADIVYAANILSRHFQTNGRYISTEQGFSSLGNASARSTVKRWANLAISILSDSRALTD